MKTYTKSILAVLALSAAALTINAQDAGQRPPGGPSGGGPGGPGGGMRNPIFAALDANSDGEIDATELNNATAALKKLDKNGDGKLTREELRPAGGPGGRGEGDRPGRREGQGGERPGRREGQGDQKRE